MANFTFNVAKGRAVELYNRVKSNDPANSALVVVILAAAGIEADAVLQDYDTLGALLAGASAEATNVGYARKVLTDADLAALPAPDDANDRRTCGIGNQTWAGVQAGDQWAKLLVCYDPDTMIGDDTTVVPLVALDLPLVPDGSDLTATADAGGFFEAD